MKNEKNLVAFEKHGMNASLTSLSDYQDWLNAIKQRVQSARLRVALAANRELIQF